MIILLYIGDWQISIGIAQVSFEFACKWLYLGEISMYMLFFAGWKDAGKYDGKCDDDQFFHDILIVNVLLDFKLNCPVRRI